jgi:hypothetical protein
LSPNQDWATKAIYYIALILIAALFNGLSKSSMLEVQAIGGIFTDMYIGGLIVIVLMLWDLPKKPKALISS